MPERGSTYYLSYSSCIYRHDSYQVHYATAPSPTGPWAYRGKIVESDARFKGPGHHAFLHDPADGGWYIAYHRWERSEEHTSELQSLMRISYAVFCLKKKHHNTNNNQSHKQK